MENQIEKGNEIMKENEIKAGIKTIAEFMGYTERFDLRTDGKPMYQPPTESGITHAQCYSADNHKDFIQLKFHSSWSAQIPVYSKLAKMMKEKRLNSTAYFIKEYELALLDNNIHRCFEILVENINWLNKIK